MEKYQFTETERALMEGMRIPFAFYQFIDRQVVTLVLSAGFCAMFGYDDMAEAYADMERNMYRVIHPDDSARIGDVAYRFATEGGKYEVIYRARKRGSPEYRIVHAKGEHVYTATGERLAQVWYTDEGAYTAGAAAREAELNSALNSALHEESMLRASFYDYLTGLPSMTYFFKLAETGRDAIRIAGGRPAMLFLDMNGMKYFNYTHGFAEGDKLLRAFALLLIRHFGSENCSRFGQDHFAVFTDDTGLKGILEKLFIEAQAINGGLSLPLRVGVYLDREDMVDVSTACDRAKLACDTLKNTYSSQFHYFDEALLEKVARRQYIIDNLDRAIQERWITVYYQPIVRAVNGRVCDEEALARWIDPVKGFMSPADFIPILEDARLIYKLDLCVVEQVLEKLKVQAAAGLHMVPQSVNLSRSDFDACDIVEEIRKRVDAAGVTRDKLTIEITESVVGSDFDFIRTQVRRFRSLGFPVWMDDFGSGYSSLDVLQSIDFNLIKFDMRFMQQFDRGHNGRIILTELMRMATALGVDTVCEGVETREQLHFLREIGCSKIQGYYYAKPMPLQAILERYEKGIQIGFEDPRESEYYETIGRVNLFDMAVMTAEDERGFHNFFNTLPMAILEVKGDAVRFVRSNPSYRDFMMRMFGMRLSNEEEESFSAMPEADGQAFMNMVRACCRDGNRAFVDERLPDNSIVHSFVRRLAVNPLTGTTAVAAAVLSVIDADQGATYEYIARALATDYFNLFYVDLDTEAFIEYSSDVGREEMALERHGQNFFSASRRDARQVLYPEDQDAFIAAFTRENVIRALDEKGAFTLTYRQMWHGEPTYVSMKAVRMSQDRRHIIIGVSNVDAQMKAQSAMERIREDQVAYARIMALSGSYIALYTVDPETGRYVEYSASGDYEGLGFDKTGEDFFEQGRVDGMRTVCPEDLSAYLRQFTRENVLRAVRDGGAFVMRYRLMLGGKPRPVSLRAALVKESDGEKLVVGVNADDQRRD